MSNKPTHIIVENLSNGNWVELIKMPIEDPENRNEEEIKETLEKVRNLFYDCDKIKMETGEVAIAIQGIDEQLSIIRVRAIKPTV